MPSPADIKVSNARFALEQAVKLGYAHKEPTVIQNAATFRDFLNEGLPTEAERQATGFSA